MTTRSLLGTLLAFPLVVVACRADPECSEDVPCGFGEVCVDGTCQGKACSNNTQCAIENHCVDGECTPGCDANTDCVATEQCDTGLSSCAPSSCRETHLDCGFKEFCNTATGECYPASGYFCMTCADDEDCGGNGNLCFNFAPHGSYCGVTCEAESDCPASFDCIELQDGNGNTVGSQCITYCWLYEQD